MKASAFVIAALAVVAGANRRVIFHNSCNKTVWVAPQSNANSPQLEDGIQQIIAGGTHSYRIPDSGWAGRFWPKLGCNSEGHDCEVGQVLPPCPAGGCQPPADTKVQFNFPQLGNGGLVFYDISLVDGYSLSTKVTPSALEGACVVTSCAVELSDCPQNDNDVGDLRVLKNGRTLQCLSPCKKWNYPSPYGLGRPETQHPGILFCCPTPPIQPTQCSQGPVVDSKYVKLVHEKCSSAYSYAYDDKAGLHNCPNEVNFDVEFCFSEGHKNPRPRPTVGTRECLKQCKRQCAQTRHTHPFG